MCETATLIYASDEESEAEILDSDVDLPLSDGENEPITYDDSSGEEGETRPRQWQLRRRHGVNLLDTVFIKENIHIISDEEIKRIPVIIDKRNKECVVWNTQKSSWANR